MNTVEKRKLEGVITTKLDVIRSAYKEKRSREHENLVEKFEKHPPVAVSKLSTARKAVVKSYESKASVIQKQIATLNKEIDKLNHKERKELDANAKKMRVLGYHVSYNGTVELVCETKYEGRYGNTRVRTYLVPPVTKHDKETNAQLEKLDNLASNYTISVWATDSNMGNVLAKFQKELDSIVI